MENNNSVTLAGLSDSPTVEEVMNYLTGKIDADTIEGIDKEIGPILENVTLLDMDSYNSLSEKLFDWLVNPSRTVDEFSYAVGPLAQRILKCYSKNEGSINRDRHQHFCKCLAEALAERNPVLEGSWEHVAWLLLRYNDITFPENIADHLSVRFEDWLIKVTGDNNFCPNPYLRIELLGLFGHLVYSEQYPNCHNREKSLQSIMFAWASLEYGQLTNYMKLCYNDRFFSMNPLKIYSILSIFIFDEDNILLNQDQKLSEELKGMMSHRISALKHDVSYNYRMNAHMKTEPIELRALSALLISLSTFASCAEINGDTNLFVNIAMALEVLIDSFKSSFMMPQLIGDVTRSISVVMFYVLSEYDINRGLISHELGKTMEMLESIICMLTLPFGITDPRISDIGRELFHCNDSLRIFMRREFLDQNKYPTMFALLSS